MHKSKMFYSEEEALQYFGDMEVEQCEMCELWTASLADHGEGGIVGPCVMPSGDNLYDRICADCDESICIEAVQRDQLKDALHKIADEISPRAYNAAEWMRRIARNALESVG